MPSQERLKRWNIRYAARIIEQGGVIAYPTESVFGLGCDPDNPQALKKLLAIKNRPAEKGLIILISDLAQARPYIEPLSEQQIALINQQQERATTWLIPRKKSVSTLLCGHHARLAVRLTQHPIAQSICHYTGSALVSTSCNLAGRPEMTNARQVKSQMFTQVDFTVAGATGEQSPSRIIDLLSGKLLRE